MSLYLNVSKTEGYLKPSTPFFTSCTFTYNTRTSYSVADAYISDATNFFNGSTFASSDCTTSAKTRSAVYVDSTQDMKFVSMFKYTKVKHKSIVGPTIYYIFCCVFATLFLIYFLYVCRRSRARNVTENQIDNIHFEVYEHGGIGNPQALHTSSVNVWHYLNRNRP